MIPLDFDQALIMVDLLVAQIRECEQTHCPDKADQYAQILDNIRNVYPAVKYGPSGYYWKSKDGVIGGRHA